MDHGEKDWQMPSFSCRGVRSGSLNRCSLAIRAAVKEVKPAIAIDLDKQGKICGILL
ncbi:MAG TPA: hypothetical protein VN426_02010 [Syntrophomonadaceae bacterium]|nr:hypothetical protein [Syntrophomonadaceae bacterium]